MTTKTNDSRSTRIPMKNQCPKVRIKNFTEVALGYDKDEAVREAKRCLQCKNAPCSKNCPVNVNIPGFIKLIAEEKFSDAAKKIKETFSFPAICGRVCPQETQCELKCVLGIKGKPVAIGHLERFAADWENTHKKSDVEKCASKTDKKIAVIGSGPAGLTAAAELIKIGFGVTVFEALHEVGGVLSYGIPEFRLPKKIIKDIIADLEKMGVKIVRNFVVGKTATVDELLKRDGFSAVFVGTGAGLPMFMNIPGENSLGVYSANEYLTRTNLMKAYLDDATTPIIKGKIVVTVGGGNVAMDAARTALRLGAQKSIIVYRRSEKEMPARLEEVHHAKEEGIEFHLLCNPVEISADNKNVVQRIKCIRMELGAPDESGRQRPVPIKNSEFNIDCDVVIMAIGNKPNPMVQKTTPDLEISKYGTICAGDDARTSKKHVYAGGDIVSGAATVILAMGAGMQAAKSIAEDFGAELL